MGIFADKDIRHFFVTNASVMMLILVISEVVSLRIYGKFSALLFISLLLIFVIVITVSFMFFYKQNKIVKGAKSQVKAYLAGDFDRRIDCDCNGELYQFFHLVNSLATKLNAQAENENREKEFLKNTMSDISHQLKTPIAALYIYNGLLQSELGTKDAGSEFVTLSEQELDRLDHLVQNLLKITKIDAGFIVLKKNAENVADIIQEIKLHFLYRAKEEGKSLALSGDANIVLYCDHDWIVEAISNLVKNALDHTKSGDTIEIKWKQFMSIVQVTISDNGSGIHPEDIYHIFKRFFRSHFSKDTPGIGLGLPLTKAIVEEHNGVIEVESELGKGTTFMVNFLIPTELS